MVRRERVVSGEATVETDPTLADAVTERVRHTRVKVDVESTSLPYVIA